MSTTLALMWDCDGLEAVVNVSDIQKQKMWAVLQGKTGLEVPVMPSLLHWQLRAQANPQRHYEIYIISVENDISVEDIKHAFEVNPQNMADTVRQIGHKFYSDRRDDAKVRII
jgi:hypothetical protein